MSGHFFPDIVKDCPTMRNLLKIFLRSLKNVGSGWSCSSFCGMAIYRTVISAVIIGLRVKSHRGGNPTISEFSKKITIFTATCLSHTCKISAFYLVYLLR